MHLILNLHDLLAHEVDDQYSAEEQIIDALPNMVNKASDRELKKALTEHLAITRAHKNRLDKVKTLLQPKGAGPEKKTLLERLFGNTKCKGTQGLIEAGEKIMGEQLDANVMDAAIIAAAQKIEHYEIAGYGTATAYARELGLVQVEKLLQSTLKEEYQADQSLTSLATGKINIEAEAGSKKASSVKEKLVASGSPKTAKSSAKKALSPKKVLPAKKAVSKKRPRKSVSKETA